MSRRHLGLAARARLTTLTRARRPGTGHLIVGVLLLVAGIGVTVSSKEAVWYGAIVVGVIEIARGLVQLMRSQRRGAHDQA